MYKSMRYETCLQPYFEDPLKWERVSIKRKHRGKVKQKMRELLKCTDAEPNLCDRNRKYWSD